MPDTLLNHEDLVDAIKSRQDTDTEFNYGILTADRYVKTIQECIGSDACYKYMAKGNTSFDDVMKKAAKSLTYSNPDMVTKDIYSELGSLNIDGLELPKNTLMVFRHVLTTPRKDRDGDILRTQGARLDPKMLLLWQHVHTLPIGKFLMIAEHNAKSLEVYSAIIDIGDLAHDSAVMVDNGMGRFSHGFKALEFVSMKEEQGKVTKPGGFDVKAFEVLEESLVSVPSNVDADTQEVIVSLVEGGKMTSSLMKSMSKDIRQTIPKQFNLPIDIKLTLNGKEISQQEEEEDDEDESGIGETKAEGQAKTKCGCGTPKEADADGDKTGQTDHKEVDDLDGEKAGKVLSAKNYKMLEEVAEDLKEVHGQCSTRSGKALCDACHTKVKSVMKSAGYEDDGKDIEYTVKDAMKKVVVDANTEERQQLIKSLQALEAIDQQDKVTQDYQSFKK